ncbi:MAG: energy transducer TonB [Gammaproteobacteria bacterium]|nr:energy transducer TonB [Gammaproteobacteria bacterium]
MSSVFISLANTGKCDDVQTSKVARLTFVNRAAVQLKKSLALPVRAFFWVAVAVVVVQATAKRGCVPHYLLRQCVIYDIGYLLLNLPVNNMSATGKAANQIMTVDILSGRQLGKPQFSEGLLAANVTLSTPSVTTSTSRDLTELKQAEVQASPVDPAVLREKQEAIWQSQYQLTSSLHKSPQPLTEIEPVYPERAGRMQGTVTLRLFISETGNVDKAIVLNAFPMGFFEESAIEAFSKTQFLPGRVLGVPVKSQMTIEVAFSSFTDYRRKE